MTKKTELPITHSFHNKGQVTCRVNSGSVTVTLNGKNAGKYGLGPGQAKQFNKAKNNDNDQWTVIVEKAPESTKVAVVFTAPDSDS